MIHERLRRCISKIGDIPRLGGVVARAIESACLEAEIHEGRCQLIGERLPVLDDPGKKADVNDFPCKMGNDMVIAQRPQRRRPHDAQDDEDVENPGDIALDKSKAAVDRVDVLVSHIVDEIGTTVAKINRQNRRHGIT